MSRLDSAVWSNRVFKPLRGVTTILIVEDHFVARLGMREFLNAHAEFKVIAEATSGEEAVAAYKRESPTVVLMDLRMPGMDGADATREIRRFDPEALVLIVSSYDSQGDLLRAHDAGARGYIRKESNPAEMLNAVRAVATGCRYMERPLLNILRAPIQRETLSSRELKILELISAGASSRDIATQLNLTYGTMRVYIHQILGKMGVANRAAAASSAIRAGLISSSLTGNPFGHDQVATAKESIHAPINTQAVLRPQFTRGS
jgi:DNA-binding NarL/FixJ family response regulator